MKLGTKSVLFGVHQFIWHPLTVARAWVDVYGRWPNWREWVVIFCHDLGYWGCPNMDGEQGTRHPLAGATLATKIVSRTVQVCSYLKTLCWFKNYQWFWLHPIWYSQWAWGMARTEALAAGVETYFLSLYHSRHFAALHKAPVSPLFLPDKLSVRYDPPWLYLLRARLSGELSEYLACADKEFATDRDWYGWYRNKVEGFCIPASVYSEPL